MAIVAGFASPAAAICSRRSLSATFRPPLSRHLSVCTRCSAAESSAVEESAASTSESSVETQKRSPFSLISAANVQKALRGIAITDADHYGRLGISRGTSYDQVKVAFEKRCEELMSKGLEEDEANKELELLKESHAILSSEEERRLYDWSLVRADKPERYTWPFEVDIAETTPETPPILQDPEDEVPTRLIGYFFLAWLILSFVLSIALNSNR